MNIGQTASAAAHAASSGGAGRTLSLADVPVLDQLVADLPAARQLAIGRQLLADPRVHSDPMVRGPLAAIRNGLAPLQPEDVGLATFVKNIRDSIDRQIGMIDGDIPTPGLAGHPEYEAVGAIRMNLDLLANTHVI